jgi:hypothetical protein
MLQREISLELLISQLLMATTLRMGKPFFQCPRKTPMTRE